jgi:hypothetical protein
VHRNVPIAVLAKSHVRLHRGFASVGNQAVIVNLREEDRLWGLDFETLKTLDLGRLQLDCGRL